MIWRLIKLFIFLVVLAGLGLIAYAYVGPVFFPADFAAPSVPVSESVIMSVD